MLTTAADPAMLDSARNALVNQLKRDRECLLQAFSSFDKLDPLEDGDACEWLVRKTCAELEIHATLKHELLYPCVAGALEDLELIEQAAIEWQTVNSFLHRLEPMTPQHELFAATFCVLGEYVRQQAYDEDRLLLPRLARADLDWQDLGPEWMARRADLQAELAPWTPFAVQQALIPGSIVQDQ
jgi:hypothetical protein